MRFKLRFYAEYGIISVVATFIIRGTGTRPWAYSLWCIALLLLLLSWRNGGWQEIIWATPILLAVTAIDYLMFWSPRVEVSKNELHIVNLFRHCHIPWSDIEHIESRYGLYIYTRSLPKKVAVWAVPSRASIFNSSLLSSTKTNRSKQHFSTFNWTQTSGKIFEVLPLADIAAALTTEHSKQLSSQPETGAPTHEASTQSFYLPHLLILATITLFLVYALIR